MYDVIFDLASKSGGKIKYIGEKLVEPGGFFKIV